MKKTINYLGILLVSLALAACSKESAAPSEPKEPETPVVEGNFSLTVATDVISRTELGSDRYIYWKSGDALSVWEAGNASNANVKLDLAAASAGQKRGTFTGSLTPAGDEFRLYAVYPYSSAYASDPSAVALSLPTAVNQVSDVNGLVGVSDFMVGSGSFSSSDTEYLMNFRYPLTLLDIVVDGSGSCLSGAIAQSVTITANTAFVGDATMDLTTGTLTPASADAGKSLVVNFPNTANMSTAQHAWVAIYPVDLTAANCCFDLKMTNGQEIKFNVNPKKAFEEQKIYTINLTNIDAHVDAGEANPVYFDLVGHNTTLGYSPNRANCYIVSEGGYYKFAAQRVDKTNVFEGSSPYSAGYRAKWLWATDSASQVQNVSLGNSGAVNFRVPAGANGSTIVAVTDPSNNIVWSWHIWCTSSDMMSPHHLASSANHYMADANLGATAKSGDGAGGFYYQWGRKDPFPKDKDACVFNTGVSIAGLSSTNSVVTPDAIGYSIAHPTTMLYANAKYTWLSTASQANAAQDLWNTDPSNKSSKKTNYDPCPAGYCMPVDNGRAWKNTDGYMYGSNLSWQSSGLVYTDQYSTSTYYPAAGYLNGLTLLEYGATSRCWAANLTATPSADANMFGNSLLLTISSQTVKVNQGSRSVFALPIRCMKI